MGIGPREVPFNLNVFVNCPIGPEGSWSIQPPLRKAGDYIDLSAEMDVLVAFSNCPRIHNACDAFRRKPLGARSSTSSSRPEGGIRDQW